MKLVSKICMLTLLLVLMAGAASGGAETTRRWQVIIPEELASRSGTFFHDLAEELGVEVDELQTAIQNAVTKRLGQVKEELQERLQGDRREEREKAREEQPERRPRRQTIIIQPQIPNLRPNYFPFGGIQRPRAGSGTLWRFYRGFGGLPYIYFRVLPGTGRR